MKLDHINISAPFDLLVELKEFYCNILALVEGDRPASRNRGFWLYDDEQAVIHLSESNSHHPSEEQGFLDHVAFSHTNIKNFAEKLENSRVHFSVAYISSIDLTQIFLHDPAGIKLEINFYCERLES